MPCVGHPPNPAVYRSRDPLVHVGRFDFMQSAVWLPAGGQPSSAPRSLTRSSMSSCPEDSEAGAVRGTAAGSSLPKSLARLSSYFRHDRHSADDGQRPVATH